MARTLLTKLYSPSERCRPRHPHPEVSQGGVREAAVGMTAILCQTVIPFHLCTLKFVTVETRTLALKFRLLSILFTSEAFETGRKMNLSFTRRLRSCPSTGPQFAPLGAYACASEWQKPSKSHASQGPIRIPCVFRMLVLRHRASPWRA